MLGMLNEKKKSPLHLVKGREASLRKVLECAVRQRLSLAPAYVCVLAFTLLRGSMMCLTCDNTVSKITKDNKSNRVPLNRKHDGE